MQLSELIDGLNLTLVRGDASIDISDLTDDSRRVEATGDPAAGAVLFIARQSAGSGDAGGAAFIDDAIRRGATVILSDESVACQSIGAPVTWLTAPKVDQQLCGRLAERLWRHPSRRLKVIGITGTNGKTTTAFIIQHLLNRASAKCGLIGTVINDDGATRQAADLTTPGAIEFSRLLAAMVRNGCEAVVAEISSHALHQGRAAALKVDVAVFTNLTQDHLDYHHTMDAYADAKAVLFRGLSPQGFAVVNGDDPYANQMLRDCRARLLRCSVKEGADAQTNACRAEIVTLAADHSRVVLDGPWGSVDVRLPLVGKHNVYNALEAVAAANCVTALSRVLRVAVEECPSPPGRLEPVRVEATNTGGTDKDGSEALSVSGFNRFSTLASSAPRKDSACQCHPSQVHPAQRPSVLVDYAHTHDALENVLSALRPLTRGRLIVLFGCGGDRDKTKRPKMAAVACALADQVIITSDNPRTEDAARIIADILTGVPNDRRGAVIIEPDRAAAIVAAIAGAGPDDVVLLAGKGHEDYQIIGKEKRHFDDREHAAQALRDWRPRPLPYAAAC